MEEYAKKQYLMSKITAICSICMLIIVLVSALLVVPGLLRTFNEVSVAMAKMNLVMGQLEEMTKQIGPGVEGLTQAVAKLETIDFSNLNDAVDELKTVVDPLAKLFGK